MRVLASVLSGRCLKKDNSLYATIETATKTTFTVGGETMELRCGKGNALRGTYKHTGKLELSLEVQDVLLEYVAMKTGSEIERGADVLVSDTLQPDETGKVKVLGDPKKFRDEVVGWAIKLSDKEAGKNTAKKVIIDPTTKETTIPDAVAGEDYCVTYFVTDDAARQIKILSTIIPAEVCFIGDADIIEDNERVGKWNIIIPRLALTPEFTLDMASNGVSSFNLNGVAQAVVDTKDCNGSNTYYAIISEEIFDEDITTNLTSISAEDVDIKVGENETINVIATFSDSLPSKIDAKYVTFASSDPTKATVDETGKVTGVAKTEGTPVTITITVKGKTTITDTIEVEVTEA